MPSEVVPTNTPSSNPSIRPEKSSEFLLAEFNQLSEDWRYIDKRIENTLNIYLTGTTIIFSGLLFLFQQVSSLRLLITLSIPMALGLLIGGIALTKRIQETDILKARYSYALSLIRDYFVIHDAKIAEHLFFHHDPEKKVTRRKVRELLNIGFLLRSILLWDSLLLGYAISATAWLIESRSSTAVLIGIGMVIAFLTFVLLNSLVKRRIAAE